MLGGSTLGIGIALFLRDQFSGPAAKIRASARQTEEEFIKMQESQMRHQRNMYAGLALAGGMALRGMGKMVKKAAEFSYEMEFVKSITNATAEEQLRLSIIAKRLGRETMFYPQDIAEGMRFMAQAGMSATETEKNIEGAVKLAGATKSLLGGKGGAADIMTNVMKQFAVGFEYTNDVADLLAYGVTRANTNLFDLGEALKYAGATSMDLNVTLGESTAMVMALGNAGMQGSMAGVAMENSMRYLARAFSSFGSGPSRRALAELGMDVKDVTDQAGNLLSMTEVMKKIGQAVEQNFGEEMNLEKQGILQSIFGVRGKRAGSLFLRNLQEFEKFSGDITVKSVGHSSRIMEDMMSTLQGWIYKAGSAWQAMWVSFTEKITPALTVILKIVTKIFGWLEKAFDNKIFGGFLAAGIAGFLVLKTVGFAYKAIVLGLRLLHLQAGTSAAIMASTITTGYNAATAAAMRYATVARAGHMFFAPGARTGGQVGYSTKARFGKGGYFIKGQGGVNQNLWRTFGTAGATMAYAKSAGVKGVTRQSLMGARYMASGVGRTMGGAALGRAIGFLGGPLGIALAFVLPGLIGAVTDAIRRSKESTDQNTKTLEEANRAKIREETQYGRVGHMIQFQDLNAPALSVVGQTAMGEVQRGLNNETLANLANQLEKMLSTRQLQPINIYIDNELLIQKILERNMADSLSILK